jgi:hypothetical protein
MKTSDWILVGTALFLGLAALVVPWLSEVVKRKAFKPKLRIIFELKPPFCHKTHWQPGNHDVYFCRFLVENTGRSLARLCEVVLEDLWIYDASGSAVKFDNFSPVNLKWVTGSSPQFIDINPGRKFFCSIGHISSFAYQQLTEKPKMVDITGSGPSSALRFLLDQRENYFSQPNCFIPGKYGIRVKLFSENSPQKQAYFEISWSGNWKTTEDEMFRELVIRPIKGFQD